MSHSYDVIKLLSKYITSDYGVFIPVSNGIQIEKSTKDCENYSRNNVAFFSEHSVL